MSSKQDRQGVRTFDQLMRRFNLDGIDDDVVTEMFKQISQLNEKLTSLNTSVTQKLNVLLSNNQTWFYGGAPTMDSYPATEWTDTTQKDSHIGDFYYDVDGEKVYIFTKCDGIYEWKSCFSGAGCDVDHDALRQEGYDEGYAEGEKNAPNPLEYVALLESSYKGIVFPAGYELILKVPNGRDFSAAFQDASGIVKLTLMGNENGNTVDFGSMFRNCKGIEVLDVTEFNAKPSTVYMMFYYCTNLRIVSGEIDFSECTNTTYFMQNCTGLEEFTPKANTIKVSISFKQSNKIKPQFVQAIIDGLAIVTDGQTITFHKDIIVSDEQKATISSKGWILVQE